LAKRPKRYTEESVTSKQKKYEKAPGISIFGFEKKSSATLLRAVTRHTFWALQTKVTVYCILYTVYCILQQTL